MISEKYLPLFHISHGMLVIFDYTPDPRIVKADFLISVHKTR